MIKLRFLPFLLLLIILLTSCSSTPTPKGIIYTKTRGPVTVTSNANITKSGKSSVISILGLFSYGDASVQDICEDNGITKIHHIDYEDYLVFLGIYQEYTIIVYGE